MNRIQEMHAYYDRLDAEQIERHKRIDRERQEAREKHVREMRRMDWQIWCASFVLGVLIGLLLVLVSR